nr:hypothetical protein GCM10025699_05950 [Microbacterium flavescens]
MNLVVDGEVVRSATGSNSEHLDWASWDVREFAGQQATVRVVDNNRGGWGHILLDQVMTSDAAAATRLESYDWLDWGRDYYATVSYFGTPDSRTRIMQGWMNNWDYANDIPTAPWRSSMTLPREVKLTETPDGPRLTQKVVSQIDDQLQTDAAQRRSDVTVTGDTALDLSGEVVKVDLTLQPGDADRAGIVVFGDGETGTRIGYDADTERVFVDRRDSGDVDFHPAFVSVEDAPVALSEDGTVTLELYLDRASVELFAAEGRVTITDQVFPRAGADDITAWSEGGTAVIQAITVTPITPTMWKIPAPVEVPGTPTEVTAAATADGATVAWTAPADDGGAPVSEYRVYREGVEAPVATASTTSAAVTGLVSGTSARFAVSAVNSAGEGPKSEWSAAVVVPDGAAFAPAKGVLSHDNGWDTGLADGEYNVTMNLWWGQNATEFRLFENGALLATVPLAYGAFSAQQASVPVSGKSNGTYVYTGELVNSKGVTATTSLKVKVSDASPAKPVLSHDNHDGDGTFTLTANLWWGTNATSYRFLEGDAVIGEGLLTARTPGPQIARLDVVSAAKGKHAYRVEFTNVAGSTVSAPVTVTVRR